MPTSAPRPCKQPGCRVLVKSGYCATHAKSRRKQQDACRGSANERGYSYKWQQEREKFLREHPLCECEDCKAGELRINQSTVVDHIVDHKLKEAKDSGDAAAIARAQKLFWDKKNWRAMAKECHDKKTARTTGFGRRQGGR